MRSRHGLASGCPGHSAFTTMLYGMVLQESRGDTEVVKSKKFLSLAEKYGIQFKEETMGKVLLPHAVEFCGFRLTPWFEVEELNNNEEWRYPSDHSLFPDQRIVFPMHL